MALTVLRCCWVAVPSAVPLFLSLPLLSPAQTAGSWLTMRRSPVRAAHICIARRPSAKQPTLHPPSAHPPRCVVVWWWWSASLCGGAVSALVVCPADMLIIQQQKTGLSLAAQVRAIASAHGWAKFSKGLLPAIGRESLFTGGYLGLAPVLRTALVKASPQRFAEGTGGSEQGNFASLLLSSIMAGVTAGVLTHPIDTVKTRMQGDLSPTSPYSSISRTASLLWQEGGAAKFFQGVAPRTARICIAVLIFNECNRLFSRAARDMGF